MSGGTSKRPGTANDTERAVEELQQEIEPAGRRDLAMFGGRAQERRHGDDALERRPTNTSRDASSARVRRSPCAPLIASSCPLFERAREQHAVVKRSTPGAA